MNKAYDYFTKEKPFVPVGPRMRATKIIQEQARNDAINFMNDKGLKIYAKNPVVGGKKKKPIKKVGGSNNKYFTESIKQSYNIWKAGRDGHTFPYTLYKNL